MDGKRPEATGGTQPVGSRISNREHSIPIPANAGNQGRATALERNGKHSDGDIVAALDWKLLSQLSVPGENASMSLHDGNGVFIEVAGGIERVWQRPGNEVLNHQITEFIEPSDSFIPWLLNLQTAPHDSLFLTTVSAPQIEPVSISLKRLPLFISSRPSQSRIVLKAVSEIPSSSQEIFDPFYFKYSSDGSLIDSNDAWIQCLGFPASEFKTKRLTELVPIEERKILNDFLGSLPESGESRSRSLRFLCANGNERTLLVAASLFNDAFEAFAQDISFDQANPLSSEQRISDNLASKSLAWVDISHKRCRISHANFVFGQMTGYHKSDELSFLDLIGRESDANTVSKILSSIQNAHEDSFELLLYRKNGDHFWGSLKTYPLRDCRGAAQYTAFTIEDITREKESQKTAIQQENLRSLGQMASGIAHDFNNLLAPILGFSELLLNMPNGGRDDAKLVSFLEKIKVAAQDGAAVVGRLREFYSSQDSNEPITTDIDLHTLAQQVKDLTQHRWKSQAEARGTNIEFKTIVETSRFVHGNEPELRQALSNLVINAVDAIEGDGAITLSIFDDKDDIGIKIQDTGCGMPENIRAKCLDPFYSTKGKLGTGLGLSIVAGVVKRHDGTIEIESEEGIGSTVAIRLPAIDAKPTEASPKKTRKSPNPLRIMLVDDEAILLEVLSELLSSGGHNVDNFENGETALEAFKKDHYDLVITDRAMPNMSGEQLAAEIKAINPHTPIIMATGFGDMMNGTDESPSNVDLVLAKPVPLDLLNQKLSELTSRCVN